MAFERHPALAFAGRMSIREIARRTGLSRNTIRKYLRAGTIEPKFTIPERPSKLDPFAEKLSGWLKTEAGKSRKQRRTAKQLHADLVALRLSRLLRPGRCLRAGVAGRPAARAADHGARHVRAPGLSAGRGLPVRLERGLGRCWAASAPSCRWRTSSCRTAGRSRPRLSAPDPRDAVRCTDTASGSSAACRGAGSTTT